MTYLANFTGHAHTQSHALVLDSHGFVGSVSTQVETGGTRRVTLKDLDGVRLAQKIEPAGAWSSVDDIADWAAQIFKESGWTGQS